MLEARGVLICRRGRSRGVEIRPDHAPGAIERIAQHCALLDMSEAEFRPILSMIGRLNRSLIGTRAEPADFAALRRGMAEQDWNTASGHNRRIHLEWRKIEQPVLHLNEKSLSAQP